MRASLTLARSGLEVVGIWLSPMCLSPDRFDMAVVLSNQESEFRDTCQINYSGRFLEEEVGFQAL